MGANNQRCLFCDVLTRNGEEVCGICEVEYEKDWNNERSSQAQAWAAKHKCRKCGSGLQMSRYFDCVDCVKYLDSEGDFDEVGTFEISDSAAVKKAFRRMDKVAI